MPETPSFDTLNHSLNEWPPGTEGHEQISELICDLKRLCDRFGYREVARVALAISQIEADPMQASFFEGKTLVKREENMHSSARYEYPFKRD
ncbi:MAG TPA: hypothetical protein V6D29_03835 [Leptolyngbyaceae cyanobacterium]